MTQMTLQVVLRTWVETKVMCMDSYRCALQMSGHFLASKRAYILYRVTTHSTSFKWAWRTVSAQTTLLTSSEVIIPYFFLSEKWMWIQNRFLLFVPGLEIRKPNFALWFTCILWILVSASVKWEGWAWLLVFKLGFLEPLVSTGMPQGPPQE